MPKCPTCGTVKCKYKHSTIATMSLEGGKVVLVTANGERTVVNLPSRKMIGLALEKGHSN